MKTYPLNNILVCPYTKNSCNEQDMDGYTDCSVCDIYNIKLENHIRKNYLPLLPISPERGVGFKFSLSDGEFEVRPYMDNDFPNYRVANLNITSWGVQHYYGCLHIDLNFVDINKPSRSVSGYLGGVNISDESKNLEIDILRRLTKEEILDDVCRWEFYDAGDLTNAFYSEDDILNVFNKLKNQIFKGKWVIKVKSYSGKNNKIIIIQ